jgi:DNA-binding HxlR family transcriptional regulator
MAQATHAARVTHTLRSRGRHCIDHDPDVFRSIMERIGDKWSLLVIGILGDGPMRFTELLRATPGISRRMLTMTLRALERDGIVTRMIHAEVPARVEYEVTELGRSLHTPLLTLGMWVAGHQEAILTSRAAFDGRVEVRDCAGDD